jgi:putative sterol carrier protein
MDKAYVYVVTNDWATNGTEEGLVQKAFSTRQKAKKYAQMQFSSDKEDFLSTFDEDSVVIEEGKNDLSVYLKNDYASDHSDYTIRKLLIE